MSDIEEFWETTVDAAMRVFEEALAALVIPLRKAKIPLDIHSGSHQWDEISEVLFQNIVRESIRFSLQEGDRNEFRFPTYEMTYQSYTEMSFIETLPKEQLPTIPKMTAYLVFHSFILDLEGAKHFPRVNILCVNESGQLVSRDFVVANSDELRFRCQLRRKNEYVPIENLRVEL